MKKLTMVGPIPTTGPTPNADELTIIRKGEHPYLLFNNTVGEARFTIDGTAMRPANHVILFDRNIQRTVEGLRLVPMNVGRIVDSIGSGGLARIIPDEGELHVQLVGALVYGHARDHHWLGQDYNVAVALLKRQDVIPGDPYLRQLRFNFPGTIVYTQESGVCIPALVFDEQNGWFITVRNIMMPVVPGIDMLVR